MLLPALLLYASCAAATLVLRQRGVREAGAVPFSVPLGPVIPVVTIALIGLLLTSITAGEWSVLVITVVAATIVFVVARRTLKPMSTAGA